MAKHDLGIDLGTATFIVYKKNEGVIINEPSVVAVDKLTNTITGFGSEVKAMVGKTPYGIEIIRPMQDGVIAYPSLIEQLLRYFIKQAKTGFFPSKPNLVIGIPARTTDVERRAVKDAAEKVGANKAYLVLEPIIAAIGIGLDITKPNGHLIVDIGGGTTDIAVISLSGSVVSESIKFAGEIMDQEIIKYVKRKYKFLIGESTAEYLKKEIGKAHRDIETLELEVRGQDLATGMPSSRVINSDDIYEAIEDVLNDIIQKTKNVLEITPPELSADILKNGIYLAGGVAKLRGLAQLFEEKTGVTTNVAEEPQLCVARGAGILLENPELLSKVAVI
ncbi:rod shape-determining protein MreB [Marinitoga sp. 1135]|uniref:Cell shape-determining protein MreB n=1 Tax=Marinitoga piezophila (strain DSM 14283 / JCM 11233 / KA3) TaxID=443254 RepID=H2J3E5_MARPK|nr:MULTISPECIES: rod shape-determining protein [Marinitoga]AEX85761.1 cell shape determining protein, MreB/Mrl family [Marinitoga piezophila KA3]APT76205.1 rod shape-determining protein MreB [Marinitoga sp. 1137]NUU95964.1 rod shape-determining protein MreB [Marinitoga sp. 1135]NUU97876.1 rod shape-determining protein MreB [Marinitoga sp. 1138]